MTPANAPASPTPYPLRLLVLFASAPIQWVTSVRWAWARASIVSAERHERTKVGALGKSMQEHRVGDQLLREKVATLMNRDADSNLPRAIRMEVRGDLNRQYYALGDSALDASVPMVTTEREYPDAQEARDSLRAARSRSYALAAQVWPSDFAGWLGLIVSYSIVAWLAWLAITSLVTAQGPATLP